MCRVRIVVIHMKIMTAMLRRFDWIVITVATVIVQVAIIPTITVTVTVAVREYLATGDRPAHRGDGTV